MGAQILSCFEVSWAKAAVALLWTAALIVVASFARNALLLYGALGLSYAGRDLADGLIDSSDYQSALRWFHALQWAGLAVPAVAMIVWLLGLVGILLRQRARIQAS